MREPSELLNSGESKLPIFLNSRIFFGLLNFANVNFESCICELLDFLKSREFYKLMNFADVNIQVLHK
jgi:hypothetical protein